MKTIEALPVPAGGARIWPLSVAAHHALGEAGLAREKQIEVWRRREQGQFSEPETHGPGGLVASEAVPEFILDVGALFAA
jgi:hypothetical protein